MQIGLIDSQGRDAFSRRVIFPLRHYQNQTLLLALALGQGATLVAAIWGVVIWKEFRTAPAGTSKFIGYMFAGYVLGLTLIGLATL